MEHTAAIALAADGDGCAGAWVLGHDELGRVRAPHDPARHRRRVRAVRAHDQPARARRATGSRSPTAPAQPSRDMEFVQFHPTALAGGGRAFLISEAVRGEGALARGRRRPAVHGRRPSRRRARARATSSPESIEALLDAGRTSYLDAAPPRSRPRAARASRNLAAGLRRRRASTCAADPIPVAPAAHYLMGGIATDLDGADHDRRACTPAASARARACTAPTGWPRTRCSSASCSRTARSRAASTRRPAPSVDAGAPPDRPQARAPLPELRRRMWAGAGPVRDEDGLESLAAGSPSSRARTRCWSPA